MTKRITKATFKSFIRKNADTLFIRNNSRFDGMVDCVMPNDNAAFRATEETTRSVENTLGVDGIWIVSGSRDYYSAYDDGTYKGIEVSNCCGSFIIATR